MISAELREAFPAAVPGLALHRTADGAYISTPTSQCEVEPYVAAFLESLTGARSVGAITERFKRRYGQLFGPELAARALRIASDHGLCEVFDAPHIDAERTISVTGSPTGFHPVHATLEIIETCNFTCEHCYYSSSPSKRGIIETAKALELLDTLAHHGVTVVELTGGECTIHPGFSEILTAASARFGIVGVISNGWLLGRRPALRNEVAQIGNVVVQISIDGLQEHHDRWRRKRGSFEAACTAARELSALGVPVRMATSVSERNVDQVGELFLLAKRLGVAAVTFAAVAALGRGCNVTEPGIGARELTASINEALAPFANDPILTAERPKTRRNAMPVINCGAGSRTYAIDYDGNVRACNFSRDSKGFGNVFEQPYESLFDQPANQHFRNAPSPGGEECTGCDYLDYCKGCFVKAFMTSETTFPECPWRHKWFPDMSLKADPYNAVADRPQLPLVTHHPRPVHSNCGCVPASLGQPLT